MEDGVIFLNSERHILFFNRAAETVVGLPLERTVGLPIHEVLDPAHPLLPFVDQVLVGSAGIRNATVVLPHDGRDKEFLVSAFHMEDAHRVMGVAVLLKDLESVRTVQSLVSYSAKLAALGRLTSGVAHEVKNPLNAMMIHVELLKELNTRPLAVVSSSAPVKIVVPVPVIVVPLPDHVDIAGPFTVSVSVPPSVPPVRLRVVVLSASPLFRFTVPPVTSNAVPRLVTSTPLLSVVVPPETRVVPATLYVPPVSVTVPAPYCTTPVPVPVILPVSVCVPPPKFSVLPLATVNAPGLVPPPLSARVPPVTATTLELLFVLWNSTLIVDVPPPLF